MKKILFSLCVLISTHFAMAQTPQGFSYQAVARDNTGNPKANTSLVVKFSILNGTPQGSVLYAETHQAQSNAYGLFNLTIGQGQATSGTFFSAIDWSGQKYLKVEIDGQLSSTTPLLSVPYALYADKTNLKAGAGIGVNGNEISNTGDLSSTNEIQSLSISGANLSISGGNSVVLPAPPAYAAGNGIGITNGTINNTGDLSTTNELQQLMLSGTRLSLSNGGGNVTLPNTGQWRDTTGLRKGVYYDGPIVAGLKAAFTNDASIIIGQDNIDPTKNLVGLFTRRFNNRNTDLQLYAYPDELSVTSYLRGITMLYSPSSNNGLQFTAANGDLRFTTGGFANEIYERMRVDLNGNIGIGTSIPAAKLQVANGDIYIQDVSRGVIMKSPDGSCWRMTVNNTGTPVFNKIPCPN